MAITSTYPIIVPKLTDLIVGTQTYTAADPVLNNPTRNFTIQSIADVVVNSGGTANTIAMFSTSGLTNSLITQAGSSITVAGDIVASKFIDVLDPAFYLQPKEWSYINHLDLSSTIGQMIDPGVQGWQLTSDSSLTTLRTDTAAFRIYGGRGSGEIIRFENDTGRVGINNTSPGEMLEVGGNIKASGSLTGSGLTLGYASPYLLVSSYINNPFFKTLTSGGTITFGDPVIGPGYITNINVKGDVTANKVNLLDSNLVPTISATLNISNNSQAAVFWSQQSECLSLRGGANSNPIQTWRNTSDVILSRIDSVGRLGIQTGTAGLGGYGLTVASGGMNISGNSLITGGNLYFGDNTTTDPNIFNYQDSLHLYAAAGNQIDLGGGIGNRQNNVSVGNGSLYVSSGLKLGNIGEYADNAAALTAGLVVGEVYRTVDLLKIVH